MEGTTEVHYIQQSLRAVHYIQYILIMRYGLVVVCQGHDVRGLSPTSTSTDPER